MKKAELIKTSNTIVAIVIRAKTKIDNVEFFTPSENPLQMAVHDYVKKRVTNIHKPSLRKPVLIKEFHKFLFITKGTVVVHLINNKNVIFSKKRLSTGDCMIMMNTFHKVVFSKNSHAIEVKQGPYESDV